MDRGEAEVYYATFHNYVENYGIHQLFTRMLEDIILHLPDDPLEYIIKFLERDMNSCNSARVIVLYPPWISDGRQLATEIAEITGAVYLTTDEALSTASETLRNEAKIHIKDTGQPLPAKLWGTIFSERVSEDDCISKGWVLDGFPRCKEEAVELQRNKIFPKHVICIEPAWRWIDGVEVDGPKMCSRLPDTIGIERHKFYDIPEDEEKLQRLIIYQRYAQELKQTYKSFLKVFPGDFPLNHLIYESMSHISYSKPFTHPVALKIIVMGGPGATKGKCAQKLADKFGIVYVNSAEVIWSAIYQRTMMARSCVSYLESTTTLPDYFLVNLLQKRLTQPDCLQRGWILTDYPKNLQQAMQFLEIGLPPTHVFFLDVSLETVLHRVGAKVTDIETGVIYNMESNIPPPNVSQSRLMTHYHDMPKSVVENRRNVLKNLEDMKCMFGGMLQIVDANQSVENICELMAYHLSRPPKTHFPMGMINRKTLTPEKRKTFEKILYNAGVSIGEG